VEVNRKPKTRWRLVFLILQSILRNEYPRGLRTRSGHNTTSRSKQFAVRRPALQRGSRRWGQHDQDAQQTNHRNSGGKPQPARPRNIGGKDTEP